MKLVKSLLIASLTCIYFPAFSQDIIHGHSVAEKKAESQYEIKRNALVIGIGSYQHLKALPHALREAELIAQKLKESGFSVSSQLNPERAALIAEIRKFGEKLKQDGGVGLVYYVGHAIPYKFGNYILPHKTQLLSYPETPFLGVPLNSIMEQMDFAKNEINILIINSNYDIDFPFHNKKLTEGLLTVDGPKGSLMVFSNQLSRKNKIPSTNISKFGRSFSSHMLTSDIDIELMFKNIREELIVESNNQIEVWQSSSLLTNFYFKESLFSTEESTSNLAKQRWETIKLSNKTALFKKFIQDFPGTPYANAAQFKLSRIYENSVKKDLSTPELDLSPKVIDIIKRMSKLLPPQAQLTLDNLREATSYLYILETTTGSNSEFYKKQANKVVKGYERLAETASSNDNLKYAHELITQALKILPDNVTLEALEEKYNPDKGWFSF